MEAKTKHIINFLILPLLLMSALALYYANHSQGDWLMHADFLDVGQGDSVLITTYQGNQILIDGGPGRKVLDQLGRKMPFYDKTIEMVVLTHPHLDHFEGLISVLHSYDVRKILMPRVEYDSDAYDEFEAAVKAEHAEITYAAQGQRIYLDDATVMDVLHPMSSAEYRPKKNDDLNDLSIVAKVTFGKTKILLTGDSGTEIEDKLLKSFNMDADLLKVGHHGSKHSTSERFLDEVTPQFAVIQVGEGNEYGHPTPQTLDFLVRRSIPVFRTDLESTIQFVSDGSKLVRVGGR